MMEHEESAFKNAGAAGDAPWPFFFDNSSISQLLEMLKLSAGIPLYPVES
jgi:hypothetical protein